MNSEFGPQGLTRLLEVPVALVKTLEAYGHVLFSAGVPLHYYRQLLAHAQREYVLTKPYMGQAWNLVLGDSGADSASDSGPRTVDSSSSMSGFGMGLANVCNCRSDSFLRHMPYGRNTEGGKKRPFDSGGLVG